MAKASILESLDLLNNFWSLLLRFFGHLSDLVLRGLVFFLSRLSVALASAHLQADWHLQCSPVVCLGLVLFELLFFMSGRWEEYTLRDGGPTYCSRNLVWSHCA